MKKYYAVRKGKNVGIYGTWDECKAAIAGGGKNEYKSFATEADAAAYMRYEDAAETKAESVMRDDCVVAYVDGSFDSANNIYSFGCVLFAPNHGIVREAGIGDDTEAAAIRNVAGELKGAIYAVKWAIKYGYNKIEIRHDYIGISKWVDGGWKAKNPVVKKYADVMNGLRSKITIEFCKVKGHSNDTFNDEADKLAKDAIVNRTVAKL